MLYILCDECKNKYVKNNEIVKQTVFCIHEYKKLKDKIKKHKKKTI